LFYEVGNLYFKIIMDEIVGYFFIDGSFGGYGYKNIKWIMNEVVEFLSKDLCGIWWLLVLFYYCLDFRVV